ncbi:MAG: DUF1178 family protein [Pseudomonadota bacterium]
MIAFDLKCANNHVFEAWFGSSSDYEKQCQAKLISCPICDNTDISKAIMAPNVGRKSNQGGAKPKEVTGEVIAPAAPAAPMPAPEPTQPVPVVRPSPELPAQVQEQITEVLTEFRKKVEENCDYVGNEFAEEARKIHYGEADERGIYGEATLDEAEELYEEGIEIAALPLPSKPSGFDA